MKTTDPRFAVLLAQVKARHRAAGPDHPPYEGEVTLTSDNRPTRTAEEATKAHSNDERKA